MPRIKLNFRQLSITDKIAKARQIIDSLTGNSAFATPTPTLAAMNTAITELETAHAETQAARQAAKTKTSAQSAKEDALDKLISQLSAYVESVGGDNEELIRSAGMDTRAVGSVSTETPTQPSALNATAGDHEGEIDLSWDTVAGSRSYVLERSPDPATASSWVHAGVSTKSRTTIKGLTPGTRYWFRVASVGTAGQSGWSDPATRIAP
ncbi:MAG TPA: fibronectin type III domain-containing protein [Pyrinomonadaceae bacterium]|jgi:hypothetical protein|nr:fibronectin type III domain-containing protein [Pyrinomonadaceae bacterium]